MVKSSPLIGPWTSVLGNAGVNGYVQGPRPRSRRRSGPRVAKAGWGPQVVRPSAAHSLLAEQDRVRLRELAEEAPDLYAKVRDLGLSQAYRQLQRRRERALISSAGARPAPR
jgi:hypothetical protein